MASDVTFDIIAKDRASRTFDRVGGSANRSSKSLRLLGKAGKYAGLGLAGGVTAAALAAGKLGQAAAQDETAARLMAKQFRNSAKATRSQIKATEDWISKMGVARGVADDDLRPALSNLVRATGSVSKSQKLASLAMDVSAATGKPLAAVSLMLAKGYNGQTAALGKLGVNMKDAKGKAVDFETAQDRLAKQFGGASATKAKSLQGQMDRLKLIFSETGESIGYKLLPPLTKAATWMVSKGFPAAQKFGDGFKDKVLPPLKDAASFIQNKALPWFKKFGDSGTTQGAKLREFGTFVRQTFNDVRSILASAQSIAQSFWAKYGDLITKYGVNTLKNAMGTIRGVFTVISGLFKTVAAVMKGDWSGAWSGVKKIVAGASQVVKSAVGQMVNQVKSLFSIGLRSLGSLASRAWDGVKSAFSNGISTVVGWAKKLPGSIGGAIKGLAGVLTRPFRAMLGVLQSVINKIAAVKRAAGQDSKKGAGPFKYTPPAARSSAGGAETGITPRMVDGARSAAKKYADALTETIYKAVAKGTPKVKTALTRVRKLLDEFRTKLADLRDLRSEFTSTFSSDSIFGADIETTGTLDKLLAFQYSQASKAKQLLSDVQTVTSKGLSKSLVAQLQASGSAGAEQLRLLAGANAQQIALFNSLNAQAQGANASAGLLAGNYVRGGNIDSEIAQTKQAIAIATAVARELKGSSLKGEVKLKGGDLIVAVRSTNHARGRRAGDFTS